MKHLTLLWLVCLRHYLSMALFRSSPASLPFHPYTLGLTLGAYLVVALVLLAGERSVNSIMMQVLIEAAILYLVSYFMLNFMRKPERLVQTLSALFGVNLVIGFVSIPLFLALPPSTAEQISPLTLNVSLLILFWNLAAISLVFKRAFEINTLAAGFIAINYFLAYEFILLYLL
jgi:hypothetical protein